MIDKWQIQYSAQALKDYRKLGVVTKKTIMKFLKEKLAKATDPTAYGTRPTGPLKHFWRYRVGDYSILAHHKKPELRLRRDKESSESLTERHL